MNFNFDKIYNKFLIYEEIGAFNVSINPMMTIFRYKLKRRNLSIYGQGTLVEEYL